jgi:hypothetical protein
MISAEGVGNRFLGIVMCRVGDTGVRQAREIAQSKVSMVYQF